MVFWPYANDDWEMYSYTEVVAIVTVMDLDGGAQSVNGN